MKRGIAWEQSSAAAAARYPAVRRSAGPSAAAAQMDSFVQRIPLCPCDGGCPRCSATIQPKLKIGAPNDKYEQEADRIAGQVMAMPEPAVQRAPT